MLTIPHNGNTLRNLKYLFNSVRDVNNRDPLLAQIFDDLKHRLHFILRQHCGGLVHNQYFCILRQSSGNFDHLLIGNREVTNLLRRINVYPQLIKQFLCPFPHLLMTYQASFQDLRP